MINRAYGVAIIISGIIALAVYVYLATDTRVDPNDIPDHGKIPQEMAIQTAQDDLRNRDGGYRIIGISANASLTDLNYVSLDEFYARNLTVPLVYIHPNQSLIQALGNGQYHKIGQCTTGLVSYCGYLIPFELNYKEHLVYSVEVMTTQGNDGQVGLFYLIDAMNGKIVDSNFVRSEIDISDYP
jgi:hypothetical protein